MKSLLTWMLLALIWAAPAHAQTVPLRRFALLIATNDGGEGRVRLRYAVTDARNFANVLGELGGVDPKDTLLLEEADRRAVLRALEELRTRVQRARDAGQRTEAIIYYSGHSDEHGLLLGRDRFGFPELRKAIETLPADVRVAVLDSCASGALARRKGGARRPAFLLDASTDVRGQAILTSSSADEASQESDRIGASFFTHHLVSGLRGAADTSRDGKVTLSEAYQFAFRETLARTESTRAGAQHPVYDIDLAGSGDLVLTDLRTQRAGLQFARDVEGRLFVRDADERLVVEIRKSAGEVVEVGLAEGPYSVFRQTGSTFARTSVNVPSGSRVTVSGGHFTAVASEATVMRGAGLQHWFVNFGLTPYAQTNDLSDVPVRNNFSLGLIAARSAELRGVGIGIAAQWIDRDAVGLVFSGGFNGVGGTTEGVQLAGGANYRRGGLRGLDLAGGANVAGGTLVGAQLSGGGNFNAGGITGFQIAGGFNHAGAVTGLQLAGGMSHASVLRGVQLTGALNVAEEGVGAQIGVLNIGGDFTGAQIGVLNIGSKVKGFQLGVLNIGSEVQGESLGLLSVVRNGQFHVEAYASDFSAANLAVKLGSRHLYTIFGAGLLYPAEGREEVWVATLGLGVHLPIAQRWFLDTDLVANSLHSRRWVASNQNVYQLRVIGGFEVSKAFSIIGGPTLNVAHRFEQATPPEPSFIPSSRIGRAALWPGFQLGARY